MKYTDIQADIDSKIGPRQLNPGSFVESSQGRLFVLRNLNRRLQSLMPSISLRHVPVLHLVAMSVQVASGDWQARLPWVKSG